MTSMNTFADKKFYSVYNISMNSYSLLLCQVLSLKGFLINLIKLHPRESISFIFLAKLKKRHCSSNSTRSTSNYFYCQSTNYIN